MFNKLKQFKDIRDKAKTIQAALANEKAEGQAGWGKVKVVLDGNQHAVSVTIDPSAMEDKTKLEEMLRDAYNDGMQKIQKLMATKLRDIGGLDLAKDMQEMMGEGDKSA
jgi:DNA-binding YbaB/EbfC family protein